MVERPRLTKAPIVEAIIDIQVGRSPDSEDPKFPDVLPGLEVRTEIQSRQLEIQSSAENIQAEQKSDYLGYRYSDSEDEPTLIVQFRVDRFTLSILKNYDSWERTIELASDYWSQYSSCNSFSQVKRVATRYINELRLPKSLHQFSDYLTCPPELPEAVPSGISSYLIRTVSQNEEGDPVIILTQALKRATEKFVPIALDIDVFSEKLPLADPDAIWGKLEECRELKNTAFFESLTPKALELYK